MPDYHKLLQEHYHNPQFRGSLREVTVTAAVSNSSCGDRVQVELFIVDGKIAAYAWQGSGCMISQAVASLIGQELIGKAPTDLEHLNVQTWLAAFGIALGPQRMLCAALVWDALVQARKNV